ncbi:VanZ family protein [Oerskovia turbata]|uniref:VanZ family protein n=1 Tax=Oerskovia turbata TaxID=1713 RepID=A0A4Q1KRQ1_9CELL|nr:VanZ family protein [Oerskovia turbata]RXR22683.1 VanZ family protein [Oerskovia turbata]RXR32019.1 VanZ family protein [Oerskovia turbata]TGJ96096.1 VanZ family protein [Actinotalea fermentans ATCC 43279 = JCM 9966 = DSM 3133]
MFHQVPVLPVVVPLAAAVFAGLMWSLIRSRRFSVPRAAVALALGVYVAGIVANTVFPVFLDKPVSSAPWASHLAVVPFADYEVADAVMNVLVFVPVGVLVPLLVPRASWRRAVAAAAVLSLTIEATQLVTAHLLGGGHIADVNDLIFNITGGAVGFAVFSALVKVPSVSAVVDRFRWHEVEVRGAEVDAAQRG